MAIAHRASVQAHSSVLPFRRGIQMATTATEPSVKRLSGALGAEVEGINLGNVSDANVEWIVRMLAEHAVLVFRGQQLGASEIASLGRKMGAPKPHILLKYRVA